ncbi:hypothetical protein OHC33_009962 [Knufia fluminis]|uniref:DUF4470 domain-containing protein n=1 Tax=Knufia fluminis TaxID=191047 RepID=A0AAN8I498_9EURO|nr:hypothetical protein OHC33_009962 [Knufia fluminis]
MPGKVSSKKAKSKSSAWEPTWYRQRRPASFMDRNTYWENVVGSAQLYGIWNGTTAHDLLKLPDNEGAEYPGDLNLLFAACGDLSSPIATVNALPATYANRCEIVTNDIVPLITMRNVIILLVTLLFPAEEASKIMMHLWYSAYLPAEMVRRVRERLIPVVGKCINRISELKLEWSSQAMTNERFLYHGSRVTLYLSTRLWANIWHTLAFDLDYEKARESRADAMSNCVELDTRHAFWLRQPTARRIADSHFMATGILAPLGQDVSEYTIPNPLLFSRDSSWLRNNGPLPPESWPLSAIKDTMKSSDLPDDDLYGGTALYVQQVFKRFCDQLVRLRVSIAVYCESMEKLLGLLKPTRYDRVDVSNVIEYTSRTNNPLNPLVLMPLLRRPHQNPYATLIASIERNVRWMMDDKIAPLAQHTPAATQAHLDAYAMSCAFWAVDQYPKDHPIHTTWEDDNAPWSMKMRIVRDLYLEPYVMDKTIQDIFGLTLAAGEAGAVLKEENTIVREWPNTPLLDPRVWNEDGKVNYRKTLEAAKQEIFDINTVNIAAGWETNIEWRVARADEGEGELRITESAETLERMKTTAVQHGYDVGNVGKKLKRLLAVTPEKVDVAADEEQADADGNAADERHEHNARGLGGANAVDSENNPSLAMTKGAQTDNGDDADAAAKESSHGLDSNNQDEDDSE